MLLKHIKYKISLDVMDEHFVDAFSSFNS